MNSCILMAEIVQAPELRYTSDTQTPIAEMLVQFPGLRPEDPPATLKVVGWGNLAQEIQEHYHQGDRVVIEGRLNMNTIDRPEGFKEKRAELTAQRIHPLGMDTPLESSVVASSTGSGVQVPAGREGTSPAASVAKPAVSSVTKASVPKTPTQPIAAEPDFDDIPF